MKKTIFTDIDETILAWRPSFIKYMTKIKNMPIKTHDDDLSVMFGITHTELDDVIFEFNRSAYFGNLKALPHARQCMQTLADHDYEFVAITACGNDHLTQQLRHRNLAKEFPGLFNHSNVYCITHYVNKGDILSKYKPSIWVEDNELWAKTGYDLGFETYLIAQSYNGAMKGIPRISDWRQIVRKLV